MYEGVTEYFAQHFQVYEGLVDPETFYSTMNQKIGISMSMDDTMSFTTMSENVIDQPYAANYGNVYQKGALIGMCIDILMREESNGNRSMLSLMKELSAKYGKEKPFVDDNLIDEITAMTYPSVGEFLNTHVVGTTPINYKKFFEKAGLSYKEARVETNYIQDGRGFIFDGDREKMVIFFSEGVKNNSFWADQGVLPGDVIKTINGNALTMQNAQAMIGGMYQWQPGQDINVVLDRDGKEMIIETVLTQSFTMSNKLVESENATAIQIETRQSWLKG
jgi:predicted metalloprotease with PDZ domain